MPELPEVETTMRGLRRYLPGKTIAEVVVRDARLRWPVPGELPERLRGAAVEGLSRRAKYILIQVTGGTLLLHLGMSGRVSMLTPEGARQVGPHDHVDIRLSTGEVMRLTDPRRFGCLLWVEGAISEHPLLRHLGREPLEAGFDGDYLFARSRGHRVAVKTFLMDAKVVVGVGNIYASEALFAAQIRPLRAAGRISRQRYGRLADAVTVTLQAAIGAGGTTLRDFQDQDGQLGYFSLQLAVYGRVGEHCTRCGGVIRSARVGQRSTFWCPRCQH